MNWIIILCLILVVPGQIIPGWSYEITVEGDADAVVVIINEESGATINGSKVAIVHLMDGEGTFILDNDGKYPETVIIYVYDGHEMYGCTILVYR